MHVNLRKLKIKIKHLAQEPAIIRKEERKCLGSSRWLKEKQEGEKAQRSYFDYEQLMHHRKLHLRPHARATQLVYAFLRNKKYSETEMPNSQPLFYNDREEIVRMIDKYDFGKIHVAYGTSAEVKKKIIWQEFEKWMNEGEGA